MVERLEALGCIAASDEADMLLEAAGAAAGDGAARLEAMLARRATGEPVEWIVGWAPFGGRRVAVHPGVYVPRAQTELLARRAAALLPRRGRAADLACGTGAIALVLRERRPRATVHATDLDPRAVRCARANGVAAVEGDLDEPLPAALEARIDVLTANVPYVPTGQVALLPRDVQRWEPARALDGGADGLDLVRRVLALAPRWLRPAAGRVLVEIGPDQTDVACAAAAGAGLRVAGLLADGEGDVRALEAAAG